MGFEQTQQFEVGCRSQPSLNPNKEKYEKYKGLWALRKVWSEQIMHCYTSDFTHTHWWELYKKSCLGIHFVELFLWTLFCFVWLCYLATFWSRAPHPHLPLSVSSLALWIVFLSGVFTTCLCLPITVFCFLLKKKPSETCRIWSLTGIENVLNIEGVKLIEGFHITY